MIHTTGTMFTDAEAAAYLRLTLKNYQLLARSGRLPTCGRHKSRRASKAMLDAYISGEWRPPEERRRELQEARRVTHRDIKF